jgi:hypothetical protein
MTGIMAVSRGSPRILATAANLAVSSELFVLTDEQDVVGRAAAKKFPRRRWAHPSREGRWRGS